jgi:hypothetical protein
MEQAIGHGEACECLQTYGALGEVPVVATGNIVIDRPAFADGFFKCEPRIKSARY